MSFEFLPTWDPEPIIKRARTWNLAADTELLQQLNDFSKEFLSEIERIDNSLNKTVENAETASIMVKNSCCKLLLLSNHQFVENRVYEDDDTLPALKNKTNEASISKQEILLENVKQSIKYGLDMLETSYSCKPNSLPNKCASDLEPKNPYKGRSLPLIIGTDQFYLTTSVEPPVFGSEGKLVKVNPECQPYSFCQKEETSNSGSFSHPNTECVEENINVPFSKTTLEANDNSDLPSVAVSSDYFGEDIESRMGSPKLIYFDQSKPDSMDSASMSSSNKEDNPEIKNDHELEGEKETISSEIVDKSRKELLSDIHNSDLFKSKITSRDNCQTGVNPSLISSLFSDDSDVDDMFNSTKSGNIVKPVSNSKDVKAAVPPVIPPKTSFAKGNLIQDHATSAFDENRIKGLITNVETTKGDLFDELEDVDCSQDQRQTLSILHNKEKPFTLFLDSSDEDEKLFKPTKVTVNPPINCVESAKIPSGKTSFVDLFEDSDDLFGKYSPQPELSSQKVGKISFDTSNGALNSGEVEAISPGYSDIFGHDSKPTNSVDSSLVLGKHNDIFGDDLGETNIFGDEEQPTQPLGLLDEGFKSSLFLPNKFQDIFGSSDDESLSSTEKSTVKAQSTDTFPVHSSKSVQKVDFSNIGSKKGSPKEDRLIGIMAGGYKMTSDEDDSDEFCQPKSSISSTMNLQPSAEPIDNTDGSLLPANNQDSLNLGVATLSEASVMNPLHDLFSRSSTPDIENISNEEAAKPSQPDLRENKDRRKDFVNELERTLGKKSIQNEDGQHDFKDLKEHKSPGIESFRGSLFDCPPKLATLNSLSKHRPRRRKRHQPSKSSGTKSTEDVINKIGNPTESVPSHHQISPCTDAQMKDIQSPSTEEEDLVSILTDNLKICPDANDSQDLFKESGHSDSLNKAPTEKAEQSKVVSLFSEQEDPDDDLDLFKAPTLALSASVARDKLASIFSDSDDDIEDIFSK